jgi:hypothetical protein
MGPCLVIMVMALMIRAVFHGVSILPKVSLGPVMPNHSMSCGRPFQGWLYWCLTTPLDSPCRMGLLMIIKVMGKIFRKIPVTFTKGWKEWKAEDWRVTGESWVRSWKNRQRKEKVHTSTTILVRDVWAYVSFVSMDILCRAISHGSAGQFQNPYRVISKKLLITVGKKT